MKSIKRVVRTKKKKHKSLDKNKNRDSNRINNNVTATKQNDKRSQNEDLDAVRDNKIPKKDIVINIFTLHL